MHLTRGGILTALVAAALMLGIIEAPRTAHARVRLENICSILGQKEVKLTGIGLVVGLNGTGDGGKNPAAMRALAAALKLMNQPVLNTTELKDAKNVAMVFIESTIPPTGLRRGQKIDCYVSAPFGAKDLRGGRLLVAPVENVEIADDTLVGLASGRLIVEDKNVPTTGKIPGGLVLEEDFATAFIDGEIGNAITLLLDPQHAGFQTASEVAVAINQDFRVQAGEIAIAKAVSPTEIRVEIPNQYRTLPVEFIAQVLDVSIENPSSQARVVVNSKTGTVVVTGEVVISPAVITHKNFTVEIGNVPPAPGGGTANRFVPVVDAQTRQSSEPLKSLVEALNQLRVPPSDVIDIIRMLHHSGKLHAIYIEL